MTMQIDPAFCGDIVYLDIKTKHEEKFDLLPAKIAVSYFITQSKWAKLREVGEDYSVWLTNYQREKIDDTIYISLEIEIRTPAMIRSGSLLKKKRIRTSITAQDDWSDVNNIRDAIEREIENSSKEIQEEAIIVGEKVSKEIYKIIKDL